jgi:hypothetical protein
MVVYRGVMELEGENLQTRSQSSVGAALPWGLSGGPDLVAAKHTTDHLSVEESM